MANVEEAKQMEVITELSKQAVQEYEGLQEEHKRTKMECERAYKERNDAMKKLKEFQRVSHMVIEEVNVIQESLEIEKTCRQSAEALASKLNRQNKSLKRKSMLYLAHLGPEVIAEISIEDEETPVESEQGTCSFGHCQQIITELRDKLTSSLDEKRRISIELQEARESLAGFRDELLKEKHNNTMLIAETIQQKKLLEKYNRVSLLTLEEYEVLRENLDLEKDLRTEAENFAREMLVEQKKLNRQSQILLQNTSPSEALREALCDVSRLTQAFETEKLGYQKQMKEIQEQLQGSELKKEVQALQRHVDLLEEDKKEWEDRCAKAEVQAKDLHFTAPSAPNPLSSLLSMIRKKRQISNDIPLVTQGSPGKDAGREALDIRHQAVDEMMQRIKKGVHLRPVSPASRMNVRQPQEVTTPPLLQSPIPLQRV
ncbi:hypothetical protein AAFF_G00140010 [Aldrovandia affinis]|uniref:Shootin-1 n=1 Tax=Aldrovandia affinis TaxID=143900 RepID=A0AAD7TC85_9TELE|nr:hypothetical protein AAFF_G00140010 [Aldrovandia affinis]